MAITVKKLASKQLKKPGRYSDGNRSGLYLQVTASKVRSWIFRYERDGRERFMGLGPVHTVDLAAARTRARAARLSLLDGIDPLDARRAAKAAKALEAAKAMTFESAAQAYFNQHNAKWRSAKHRDQFLASLRNYALSKVGKLSVAAIDTGLVLSVLEPIWSDKTETANRLRGRIEAVLDWAAVRGYRSGDNPARWKGHLDQVLPARVAQRKHYATLPYTQVGEFIADLRKCKGMDARALEFLILTAARTNEVIGARWSEVDTRIWTIPGSRMKSGREHRVPLSSRAVEILRSLPREKGNEHIFIGLRAGAGLSKLSMFNLLKSMRPEATVHGFRSSFRDFAEERTSYPSVVAEMALAHLVGSEVERAYRRTELFEKRRLLMEAWAKLCSTPVGSAKVLAIR